MADFFGTSINESPTIILPASEKIAEARGMAMVIKNNGLAKPAAGEVVSGICLMTNEDTLEVGDEATIQIKDIGKWKAAGTISVGDLLATDAAGLAVKATTGQFIVAQALSAATKKGSLVKVQIIKAGYAK